MVWAQLRHVPPPLPRASPVVPAIPAVAKAKFLEALAADSVVSSQPNQGRSTVRVSEATLPHALNGLPGEPRRGGSMEACAPAPASLATRTDTGSSRSTPDQPMLDGVRERAAPIAEQRHANRPRVEGKP
eukprot:4436656-Prymnesium_polylepis.3